MKRGEAEATGSAARGRGWLRTVSSACVCAFRCCDSAANRTPCILLALPPATAAPHSPSVASRRRCCRQVALRRRCVSACLTHLQSSGRGRSRRRRRRCSTHACTLLSNRCAKNAGESSRQHQQCTAAGRERRPRNAQRTEGHPQKQDTKMNPAHEPMEIQA